MLTQCPNCETTFRVTAEILRVADGQVRCGRCHTQFDALERLLEEADSPADPAGRFPQSPPAEPDIEPEPEQIEVEEPESEDITLEGKRIEISGNYRVVDDEGTGESHLQQEVTEEWAEIEDEVATNENDSDIDPTSEPASTAGIEVIEDEAAQAPSNPIAVTQPPLRATRAPLGARPQPVAVEAPDELPIFATPRREPEPRIWAILLVPLALLLLMQVVHHYRSELARHPRLGPPLSRTYEALGLELTPDWDLHAYEIQQWRVAVDPAVPGTLKVRASITNRAAFAQPYPLLKLMLEDRWGDQVRAREFEPAEYVDPGSASNRMLGPGQQTNATIAIVDPGPDAEGFRFDVCLKGKAGPVCAGEVPESR